MPSHPSNPKVPCLPLSIRANALLVQPTDVGIVWTVLRLAYPKACLLAVPIGAAFGVQGWVEDRGALGASGNLTG